MTCRTHNYFFLAQSVTCSFPQPHHWSFCWTQKKALIFYAKSESAKTNKVRNELNEETSILSSIFERWRKTKIVKNGKELGELLQCGEAVIEIYWLMCWEKIES